uniref:Uncharacterized protein n=1 Tax=Romanomermis culicivorax TaxID=13658 RepID=A0A915KXM9_ROMCU
MKNALDGKHARNTGASSPVGELLDHGVDVWRLAAPMLSCVFSLFGRGFFGLDSYEMVHLLLAVQGAQFLTLWQQYLTKTMYYNWVYDIGQYYMIGFYLMTYFDKKSTDCWQTYGYFFGSNAHVIEKC